MPIPLPSRLEEKAADYVVKNNLFSGTSANIFSPNLSMTRAMLWTVLHRQSVSPAVSGAENTWYGEAQKWVVDNNISDGTKPNGDITREQMSANLYRYAQFKGYDTTQCGMSDREFSDKTHHVKFSI